MGKTWATGWRFRPRDQRLMPFGRFGSFADAVFAIVATILVLELRIPEHLEPGTMGEALSHLAPHYAAYAIGSAFVMMGWIQSRRISTYLKGIDHYSTLMQTAALFAFAMAPFLTKLLTASLGNPTDLGTAVRLTAVILFLSQVLWALSLIYPRKRGMFRSDVDPDAFELLYGLSILYWVPPASVWALSFVSPGWALGLLVVAYIVPFVPAEPSPSSRSPYTPARRVLPPMGWWRDGWKFRPRDHGVHSFERLGTLIDGVYAIVATLIVLELRLPEFSAGGLHEALAELAPEYAAYALGLFFALGGWLQARRAGLWLKGVDHYATLFCLVAICTYILTPFVARVMAHSFSHPEDLGAAVRLAAAVQFITIVAWIGLFSYAGRRKMFIEGLDPQVFTLYRWIVARYWLLPLGAWLLSYAAPWPALALVVLYFIGILIPIEAHPHEGDEGTGQAAEPHEAKELIVR